MFGKGKQVESVLRKIKEPRFRMGIGIVRSVTSLSVLELLEYNIGIEDIIYSMANGVVTYDNLAIIAITQEGESAFVPSLDHYYAFVRRKLKLRPLGLHILESIKGNQYETKNEAISFLPLAPDLATHQQFLKPIT